MEKEENFYTKPKYTAIVYAPLTWEGAIKKYLDLFNRVQAKAIGIISREDPRIPSNLQNLQRRRDIASYVAETI